MIRVAALPWAAWWLVPLAVAIAFLGWETDWGRALAPVPEPVEPIVAKPVTVSVLPDFTVEGGLAARPETVARTLFNPTRRPAPPVVAEAPKPTMKRGQFTLTGTLVVEGKSTAFLREVAGGKARRVLQGESINGLVVAEVKPDRVRLTMGDESEDLILKVQTNPKPTAVAARARRRTDRAGSPRRARLRRYRQARRPSAPVATPQPAGANSADLLARRRAAREAAAAAAAAPAASAARRPPTPSRRADDLGGSQPPDQRASRAAADAAEMTAPPTLPLSSNTELTPSQAMEVRTMTNCRSSLRSVPAARRHPARRAARRRARASRRVPNRARSRFRRCRAVRRPSAGRGAAPRLPPTRRPTRRSSSRAPGCW